MPYENKTKDYARGLEGKVLWKRPRQATPDPICIKFKRLSDLLN